MVKIAIFEDEPAATNHLKFLLTKLKFDYEILIVLETVNDAIQWLSSNPSVDLIFTDIQLADGLSFEIFENSQSKAPIIFITAFDEFAIRAFKQNSVDYILKPLEFESLNYAISKFKTQSLLKKEYLEILINQKTFTQKKYRKSFLIPFRGNILPIKVEEFSYFYIDKSIVWGNLKDGRKYNIDLKLEEIENQLDPQNFIRANRQIILSRGSVKEMKTHIYSRLLIITEPSTTHKIVISKEKVSAFKKWFERGY